MFDLLLDIVVKKREYDDTVFCIDEPEAHMNARLQVPLLDELLALVPDGSQLWLSTHSIGMMRRARDLARATPGEIIFLDFENRDFDQPQILSPEVPSRAFWERTLKVALDDMAALVAPETVVVCEGAPGVVGAGKNADFDAHCYNTIFSDELPEVKFISGGNSHDVESDRLALQRAIGLVGVPRVIRLRDRDSLSPDEIDERVAQGIHVISRRHIEAKKINSGSGQTNSGKKSRV